MNITGLQRPAGSERGDNFNERNAFDRFCYLLVKEPWRGVVFGFQMALVLLALAIAGVSVVWLALIAVVAISVLVGRGTYVRVHYRLDDESRFPLY